MNASIFASLVGAAVLASTVSAANAQTKPLVATITVPVTIANLDTEYANRANVLPLKVQCVVSAEPTINTATVQGSVPIATGVVAVPLQEKAATTSVRSTLSYSGSLSVPTYAPDGYRPPEAAGGDSETEAQRRAEDAIRRARSYACFFDLGAKGQGFSLLRDQQVGPSRQSANSNSTFIISGTFPSH